MTSKDNWPANTDELSSGTLNKGDTFSHIFKATGTYDYTCAFHPDMFGRVIVIDKGATIIEVTIKEKAFEPSQLTIGPGTYVRWTNKDFDLHDVISTPESGKPLVSGPMGPDSFYIYQFTELGPYNYKCSLHPDTTGTVTVEGD